jgi:hypothetical protein
MKRDPKYDEAYEKLQKDGVKVWMHPIIRPYVPKIYEMMIEHYVSQEEYEKCQFLSDMKLKYEKSLLLSKIFEKIS